MAKVNLLLCFVTVLLCISLSSGSQNVTNGRKLQQVVEPNTWCVASPSASEQLLKLFIQFMKTKPKGSQCIKLISTPAQPCYLPNTVRDHASVCLNEFYKTEGPCQLGQVITTNPSHGNCIFM